MLISKLSDEKCKENNFGVVVEDDSHEYQTANELFELMSKNQNFNSEDGSALTPGELVLLYKNIDRGTRLMSNAKDVIHVNANQRVETVVYDGVESDSELSDVFSNEDLQNVILVNKEQIDFLNIQPSVEHTLCHKFGDFELETSSNNDYDKHFLFQDPFIKEQLKNCNLISINKEVDCSSVLPPSLLDYICCRRLEDNYNFYMDNIIRYVKNTIDQLKRISNGDYLTAKAKEKWKEVENSDDVDCNNTKVLATSTSIPLHVECKVDGFRPTWDDIVHSAVDIRSLSKILEKKIIVEIPKFIKGSYTLLSRYCDDNLIISYKKDEATDDSRVDVVLQLTRSETGHVISKISSIMVLQTAPPVQGSQASKISIPLVYKPLKNITYDQNDDAKIRELNSSCKEQDDDVKIIELNSSCKSLDDDELDSSIQKNYDYIVEELNSPTQENYEHKESYLSQTDSNFELHPSNFSICAGEIYPSLDVLRPRRRQEHNSSLFDMNQLNITETKNYIATGSHQEKIVVGQVSEAAFKISSDDLGVTIKNLDIQSALPEETWEDIPQLPVAKKSSTRVRIKSPYENQSHVLEEKKRKKLLEIREKREKRKKAQIENCKLAKNKFDSAGIMPLASTSVTKLSITNKSFYNSIYGDTTNVEVKHTKNKNRKRDVSKEVPDMNLEKCESEIEVSETSHEIETQKFINRSYYLDDTVTEMMYMNMKQQENEKEIPSPSTSGISCDFRNNLNLNIISELMIPFASTNNDMTDEVDTEARLSEQTSNPPLIDSSDVDSNERSNVKFNLATSQSRLNVPSNTPKGLKNDNNIKNLQVECRKSIDKIYQLMNKKDTDHNKSGCKAENANIMTNTATVIECSIQGSESGTSLKHQTSSSPSTFSFDKPNNEVPPKNTHSSRNVVPKVIISSRTQMPQNIQNCDVDQNRKDRNLLNVNTKIRDKNNPLKAISQLLHEFENVQRNRTKTRPEPKHVKNIENPIQNEKQNPLQGSYKRKSRLEQHNETLNVPAKASPVKQIMTMDNVKVPFQQIPIDARISQRCARKKMNDIFDEAKEARGEAVKGPSRFTSRLNSLAQPKKSYVQAHSEEYQTKYGRNLITDRLQRLTATPAAPPILDKTPRLVNSANKNKGKRPASQAISPVSLKLTIQPGLSLEKGGKARYSNNSSPDRIKHVSPVVNQSYKNANVPEPSKILKKERKMVAVESYVKSHYGRSPPIADKPQKSRAPVLPNDIDTGSSSNSSMPQESTEIGSRLHHIIESMLGLEALSECFENTSKSSHDNVDPLIDGVSLNVLNSQCDEISFTESEDVYKKKDRNITSTAANCTVSIEEQRCAAGEGLDLENQSSKSATTIDRTEELLASNRLSMVALSDHKKIEKHNLTPQSSIQKLLFLQSGDAGSVMVKSALSPRLLPETFTNLIPMRALSKAHWDLPIIPEPITLAYLFPEYDRTKLQELRSPSLTRLFQHVSKASLKCSPRRQNAVDISIIDDESLSNTVAQRATDNKQRGNNEKLQSVPCEQSSQIGALNPTVPFTNLSCFNNASTEIASCLTNHRVTVENKATDNKEEIENKTNQIETNCFKENYENDDASKNSRTADYTTSLDILMGLLNEIQKITTCQNSYITKKETEGPKELEMILNNSSGMVNSIRSSYNFSISSLDKLRCLESNQSVYSFYISDNELLQDGQDKNHFTPTLEAMHSAHDLLYKPICVDKEVTVNISNNEHKDKIIDAPSLFFPVTISQSTNVSNAVLKTEKLCQSSKQAVLSVRDYHSKYSKATSFNSIYSKAYSSQVIEVLPQKNEESPPVKTHPDLKRGGETKPLRQKARSIKKYENVITKESTMTAEHELCVEKASFDPVMKLKRDILVTVYSMLVLTVFAALSFPEMLYYVV